MRNTRVRRPWSPPTLADVAARAEVSKATASRALSSRTTTRPQAYGEVRRAARELGYHPGLPDAPHLLVLTSDVARTGYWEALSGIVTACQDLDADMSVHVLTRGVAHWLSLLSRSRDMRIDGLVILEFDSLSVEALNHLPADIPAAIAGGYPSAKDTRTTPPRAWVDDRLGAVQATDHLLALGHRSVVYVGVPSAGHPDPRLLGWREAMTRVGLPANDPMVIGWGTSTGIRAASAVVACGASAVLCGNDDLALGLIAGLTQLGLDVPGDISVVGIDDHPHAVTSLPPLTTVRLDFSAVGEAAARLALGERREREVQIPVELVVRESTAPRRATAS